MEFDFDIVARLHAFPVSDCEIVASLLPAGDLPHARLPTVYVATIGEKFAPPTLLNQTQQQVAVEISVVLVAGISRHDDLSSLRQIRQDLRSGLAGFCPNNAQTPMYLLSGQTSYLADFKLTQWQDRWQFTYLWPR